MRDFLSAVLFVSVLLFGGSRDADARELDAAREGCTNLARAIYSEVRASALHGTGRAGPWLIEEGGGDVQFCDHVARTVSKAFTLAMASAGIDVAWQYGAVGGQDYCVMRYLSQCFPDHRWSVSGSGESKASMVRHSWDIVARAVMREMYNPVSSDEVSFRGNDLKLRLGLSLRQIERSVD